MAGFGVADAGLPIQLFVREGDPLLLYRIFISGATALTAPSHNFRLQIVDTCAWQPLNTNVQVERLHANGDYLRRYDTPLNASGPM